MYTAVSDPQCTLQQYSIYCIYCTYSMYTAVSDPQCTLQQYSIYCIYCTYCMYTAVSVPQCTLQQMPLLLLLQPARHHYRTESLHPSDFRWHLRCRGRRRKQGTILNCTNLRMLQMLGKRRIGKYSQQDAALMECYGGWNENYRYIYLWKGGSLER